MYSPFVRLLPFSNASTLTLSVATKNVDSVPTKVRFSTNSVRNCNKNSATTAKDRTFPPYMINGRPMVISIARPQDAEELYQFSLQHLFPAAPLRQIHRFDESDETRNPLWKLEQYKDYLKQPYSVIARDPDAGNEIISFVTSKILYRPTSDTKPSEVQQQTKDRSPGWICRALYSQLNNGIDLFSMFNTDRIFYMCTWAAHKKILRSGLSYHIGNAMIKLAEDEGVAVQVSEPFSKFTANALSKRGFKVLREIMYDDFEVYGEKPLAGIPELGIHVSASVMARLSADDAAPIS